MGPHQQPGKGILGGSGRCSSWSTVCSRTWKAVLAWSVFKFNLPIQQRQNRIDDCTWLHYTSQDPTKTPALDLHNVSAEYSPHLLTLSHATLKVGKSILPICKICWIWKVHGVKMANNGRWNPQLHHLYQCAMDIHGCTMARLSQTSPWIHQCAKWLSLATS